MTIALAPHPVDYRELMKKVERVVAAIEQSPDLCDTVHSSVDQLLSEFRAELGLFAGRLYRRQGQDYVLDRIFGAPKETPLGLVVSHSYPPVEAVLEQGTVYMDRGDPRTDPELERRLGVEQFVAIEVGDGDYILAFDVAPGHDREDVLFSLGILRHTINQKLREERTAGVFNEARKIQLSILPRRSPEYEGFDIAGKNEPMASVGGDLFDYIQLGSKILGIAIADVSGHGLPAALQVRDVYMGLRMGMAKDYKIVRTVERLNTIIHHSTLTSRFVSMFYGELEAGGNFIYVNAGHVWPFLLTAAGEARFLREGGPVLGPLREAEYERGFLHMEPGDLIVLYTDGITETLSAGGDLNEEFGVDRLIELCRENRHLPARELVTAILDRVKAFSGERPVADDRTVVVIRRAG